MSSDEILDDLTVFVAGRVAEEVVFGVKTTGAANDIERASKLARAMIAQYGMSDEFGMAALESTENKYLDGRNVSNCSEETKTKLDNEVVKVIKDAHDKAKAMLEENIEALHKISEYLIEKETITGSEFMKILREVQNKNDDNLQVQSGETKTEAETETDTVDNNIVTKDSIPKTSEIDNNTDIGNNQNITDN